MTTVLIERHAAANVELERLHGEFATRLSTDLQALRIDAARAGLAQDQLAALRDRCHRMAGSALTFGHAAVGQALHRLEQVLELRLADPDGGDADVLAQAVAALPSAVRSCFHAAPAATGAVPADARPLLYVLEDDPDSAALLQLNLDSFGYRVETFGDAAGLRARFAHERPDALLVDIALGQEDGLVVSGRLLDGADLPLVVVSKHQGVGEKLRAVRQGAQGFFAKPLDVPALHDRLDQLLLPRRQPPFRVLLSGPDPASLDLHRRLLEAGGCEVAALQGLEPLLEVIADFRPEVLVFDLGATGEPGPHLARLVRLHGHLAHLPLVFLAADPCPQRQRDAVLAGADDCLAKPVPPQDFVALVRNRAQRARQVARLVLRDSLTGLLQHGEIKERLARELHLATRQGRPLAVAMVDIDHFKQVNDRHGHPTGDRVIHALAQCLEQNLRRSDLVGRYGGEEFLLVLPDACAAAAATKLDALREAFGRIAFPHADTRFHCSFSAGVVDSSRGSDPEALLVLADQALYRAKHAGRDRVAIDAPDGA